MSFSSKMELLVLFTLFLVKVLLLLIHFTSCKWCILHVNTWFLLKVKLARLTASIGMKIKYGKWLKFMLYSSIASIKGTLFILICIDLFGCMRKPVLLILEWLHLENKNSCFFFSPKEASVSKFLHRAKQITKCSSSGNCYCCSWLWQIYSVHLTLVKSECGDERVTHFK